MVLDTPPDLADVLDAKRQLVRDNAWLWEIMTSLRRSDETIENGRRCCAESRALLRRLGARPPAAQMPIVDVR